MTKPQAIRLSELTNADRWETLDGLKVTVLDLIDMYLECEDQNDRANVVLAINYAIQAFSIRRIEPKEGP